MFQIIDTFSKHIFDILKKGYEFNRLYFVQFPTKVSFLVLIHRKLVFSVNHQTVSRYLIQLAYKNTRLFKNDFFLHKSCYFIGRLNIRHSAVLRNIGSNKYRRLVISDLLNTINIYN